MVVTKFDDEDKTIFSIRIDGPPQIVRVVVFTASSLGSDAAGERLRLSEHVRCPAPRDARRNVPMLRTIAQFYSDDYLAYYTAMKNRRR